VQLEGLGQGRVTESASVKVGRTPTKVAEMVEAALA
jgi:hypothetical protein